MSNSKLALIHGKLATEHSPKICRSIKEETQLRANPSSSVVLQKLWFALHTGLSLSGACQEDLAASTSVRHAGLFQARHLADARPKLSGHRSSSTVLSQVCLGLPVLCRQSLGGPRMQAWRAREWSWLASARQRWPKKDRRCRQIVSDSSGCPIRDRTTSLETKSVH